MSAWSDNVRLCESSSCLRNSEKASHACAPWRSCSNCACVAGAAGGVAAGNGAIWGRGPGGAAVTTATAEATAGGDTIMN